jgi:hypothetical protein
MAEFLIHNDVSFPTYLSPEMHGKRLWKRGRKGIMVSAGWSWWEQAGHGRVELITGCTMACFRKQTEKK